MNALLVGFLVRREAGERITLRELQDAHPEIAHDLGRAGADLFELEDRLRRAGSQTPEPFEMESYEAVRRLTSRRAAHERYECRGEVARGGMGSILEVWDTDLRRPLAMKVALGDDRKGTSSTPRQLARFLDEARITGQLDHPGIVPIHELGLDENGRMFFTMKLVEGRTLREIYERVDAGDVEWSRARALGLLVRICEAMAYAHDKGVVHRDLKPANVMVGRFGELFVMDWGLARARERKDFCDLRIDLGVGSPEDARAERDLRTLDGEVLGTPAYMSPEQARGTLDEIGPRTDVYAIGAMLYHLLAGHAPYYGSAQSPGHFDVWMEVKRGPPAPLRELDATLPAELVAVCERAMAREIGERYASMLELGGELRAYLEGRVVRAYEAGAKAELSKWIGRNRPLAIASAVAALVLVAGAVVSTVFYALADRRADDVMSLSAMHELRELERRADALFPTHPGLVDNYQRWLTDAELLLASAEEHAQRLERLRGRANTRSDPGKGRVHPRQAELDQARSEAAGAEAALQWIENVAASRPTGSHVAPAIPPRDPSGAIDLAGSSVARWYEHVAELERAVQAPWGFEFASSGDRWWHDQLTALLDRLDAFRHSRRGLLTGLSPEHGPGVETRLAFALELRERSLTGPAARTAWQAALASVADASDCPAYRGLRLEPQLGLLPIGRDPDSGLWEFAHLETGAVPERDPTTGTLRIDHDTGLVFVLLPGGAFWMGAQGQDPNGHNYDTAALPHEAPVHELTLEPFLLSKYEMTQAQWLRQTGINPSQHLSGATNGQRLFVPTQPVERVSWNDCERVLYRLGLALPTEAQLEYASRAGADTPWISGADPAGLDRWANLADAGARAYYVEGWRFAPELDDGFAVAAPVGSFAPNAFGLHDLAGNVWEWCADWLERYGGQVAPGDGERRTAGAVMRTQRGGSFFHLPVMARSSHRGVKAPDEVSMDTGVRPARALDR